MSDAITRAEALLEDEQWSDAWQAAGAELASCRDDNLRAALHRVAGLAAARLGDTDAREHLEVAFAHDPRDGDVAMALGQLRWVAGERAAAVDAFEALWIHHAPNLGERSAAVILRRIADVRIESGDLEAATVALEHLVDRNPDDLDAARDHIKLLSQRGYLEEAIEARSELLAATSASSARSALLHAQADDLRAVDRFGEALGLLVEAVTLNPHDDVFASVCAALEVHERFDELVTVIGARLMVTHGADACACADEIARVAAGPLNNPVAAARALERALDHCPTELHRFERITQLLSEAAAWRELHDAYARMIERAQRHEIENPALLGLLWRNLGEVNRTHLGEPDAALYAMQMAARHIPDDEAVGLAIVDLTETHTDLAASADAIATVLDSSPTRIDIAERLGAALLKRGDIDRAWLVLREVVAAGAGTASIRNWVARHVTTRPRLGKRPLDGNLLATARPNRERLAALDTVFTVAWHALREHHVRDLEEYGVDDADRIDLQDDLLLARLVQEGTCVFGLDRVPHVYVSTDVDGLVPVARPWPTFLVSPALLSGQSETQLRALIGLRLAMSSPSRRLAALLAPDRLKLLLAAVVHHIQPDFDVELTTEMERAQRLLDRELHETWLQPLRLAVERLFADERLAHVDRWLDDTIIDAACAAVLFADSASAVRKALAATSFAAGRIADDDMLDAVSRFGWSKAHVRVRRDLNLSIQ